MYTYCARDVCSLAALPEVSASHRSILPWGENETRISTRHAAIVVIPYTRRQTVTPVLAPVALTAVDSAFHPTQHENTGLGWPREVQRREVSAVLLFLRGAWAWVEAQPSIAWAGPCWLPRN